MIVRISNNEYLTRVNNMTAVEREEYLNRVGEWLKEQAPFLMPKMNEESARFQNVIQCSVGWNDVECKAWTDGVVLMTAYAATGETWLPDMLYVKAARRSIRKVVDILQAAVAPLLVVNEVAEVDTGNETITEEQRQRIIQKYGEAKEEPAEGTGKATQDVASFRSDASNGDIAGGDNYDKENENGGTNENDNENEKAGTTALVPARPKHIDQYVYLLPKKTQERAAKVQELLRELDAARENERKLMNSNAHPDTIAQWAKMATNLDNKLKSIYQELDDEWARLAKSGRVTVDDLGNAHVVPGENENDNENDNVNEKAELTPEQRERRKNIRKWLTDTRRGNGAAREERVKKWHENFKEYLTLEGDAAFKDEKIIEAAKHYGIDLERLMVNG